MIAPLAPPSKRNRYLPTTRAMQRLAREIRALKPDIIVIATPHNLQLRGHIAVVTAENASGTLPAFGRGPARLRLRAECDPDFGDALLAEAKRRRLPAIGADYTAARGPLSNMPLDFGTLVPLWFFIQGHRVRPKLVVVTPSRDIPLSKNLRFGTLIADVAEKSSKRVVFVASGDHAHAHKKSGPYGFSRAAARYDALMVKAILEDDLTLALGLGPKLAQEAKPDSLWPVAMLAGAAKRLGLHSELLSYQVPAYYGMICAAFRGPTSNASIARSSPTPHPTPHSRASSSTVGARQNP